MAITFVGGAANANAAAATIDVTPPTMQNDDFVVAAVNVNLTGVTISADETYTFTRGTNYPKTNASQMVDFWYRKVTDATNETSNGYTFSHNGANDRISASILVFRGIDTTTPFRTAADASLGILENTVSEFFVRSTPRTGGQEGDMSVAFATIDNSNASYTQLTETNTGDNPCTFRDNSIGLVNHIGWGYMTIPANIYTNATHDAASSGPLNPVLTDSGESWTTNEFANLSIVNTTDSNSIGIIGSNTGTTMTVVTSGGTADKFLLYGTDNDFDSGDVCQVRTPCFDFETGSSAERYSDQFILRQAPGITVTDVANSGETPGSGSETWADGSSGNVVTGTNFV